MSSPSIALPPGARIHIVGIGGAGMSAIATVLIERGYRVSGSDQADSDVIRSLRDQGAQPPQIIARERAALQADRFQCPRIYAIRNLEFGFITSKLQRQAGSLPGRAQAGGLRYYLVALARSARRGFTKRAAAKILTFRLRKGGVVPNV